MSPNHYDALHILGVIKLDQGHGELGVKLIRAALRLKPNAADAQFHLGVALAKIGRHDEAIASYDKALAVTPGFAVAHYNRGNALQSLNRREEAVASYRAALALKADYIEALNNCGLVLTNLQRHAEAIACFDKVLALRPDHAFAHNNRGLALAHLKRHDEAIAGYGEALRIKPDYANAFYNRGISLSDLNRFQEAIASYDRANALGHRRAFNGSADCTIKLCDWTRRDKLLGDVQRLIVEQKAIIHPFTLLSFTSDESLQRTCAGNYVQHQLGVQPQPLRSGAIWRNDRIRVAYVSSDFHRHATANLIAEMLERHDRSRFEIIGVSFGPDDGSKMRARLLAAFDRFIDVGTDSDEEVARLLHRLQIDVAVDLKGHTKDSRLGIFAFRPAPIQVSYLGYPGTTGADFIDYVIADAIVLPFDRQLFYTEKIVHLPDCYQVNDRKRAVAAQTPTRGEVGLPEEGFVFCSFNNSWKITPAMFDVWMRLLRGVEGSVLWLLRYHNAAEANLCKEAAARGIDPARLVFAGPLPTESHLARYRLADLFLDTLPYNAHTTASDALWAGLPVLTCSGESFAGRVAASALHAVGLPELVTHSLGDYEASALRYGRDRAQLHAVRNKLSDNGAGSALFDTDRFCRHIEAAYTMMWELWQRGELPRSFSVDAGLPKSG